MRIILPFLVLFIGLNSCSSSETSETSDAIEQPTIAIDSDPEMSAEPPSDSIVNTPSLVLVDTFNIVHYFKMLCPDIDYNRLDREFDYKKAHKEKRHVLMSLDYQAGYISTSTANTPPWMDGDSETEFTNEITYWNLSDNKRLIAHTESRYTWVDEENMDYHFYVHDKNGWRDTILSDFSWNLDDFIYSCEAEDWKELSSCQPHFDDSFYNHPAVMIILPMKGKDITIRLNYHEYMDDEIAREQLDKMEVKTNFLKFNPTKGQPPIVYLEEN